MTQPESQRFLPDEHLRRPGDFQRVYQRRRSVSDQWIIVYGCENGLPHLRLGLSVSRKFGGAVQRNRLRRIYREAFRLSKDGSPVGLDLVIIPRTKDEPALADLKCSLAKLIGQLAGKIAKENKPK